MEGDEIICLVNNKSINVSQAFGINLKRACIVFLITLAYSLGEHMLSIAEDKVIRLSSSLSSLITEQHTLCFSAGHKKIN